MRNVTKDNITDVFNGYMADDMEPAHPRDHDLAGTASP